MKIVLTGGGTLGPVAPLIAVWQALKEKTPAIEVLFIGTSTGPERAFLAQYPEIKFRSVPAGKIRRYFSILNLLTPFLVLAGFLKSLFILARFKPSVIVSAGGFVAVPVILAGKLCGAKIFIHQLDLAPSLSNVLVKKLTDTITVTFSQSLADFKEQQPILIGSLIRQEAKDLVLGASPAAEAKANSINSKIILFLGGGTGAQPLNELAVKTAPLLGQDFQVWQITGKHKKIVVHNPPHNFQAFEFLTKDYYQKVAQADLVISRGGLSTLMELSDLLKPTVIVPIPHSQQEENARYFADRKAAVYLEQTELTPELLAGKIKALLQDAPQLASLAKNIEKIMDHGGEEKLADLIWNKRARS